MSLRIRWSQAGAVILVGALVLLALRVAPSLLRAPEPPPVPADVGLPRIEAAPVKPIEITQPKRVPPHPEHVHRRRKRKHHAHHQPKQKNKERLVPTPPPVPPPTPEAPEEPASSAPPPEASPPSVATPTPEPAPPDDGSSEFAPH